MELENLVVLATVQALIGVITPSIRALALEVDPDARTATIHVALWRTYPELAELLEDLADDINTYSDDAVAVTTLTWIGQDSKDWPGSTRRLVYAPDNWVAGPAPTA